MTAILSIQFAEKLDLDFVFGWRSAGAPSTSGFGAMGWSGFTAAIKGLFSVPA
jgi:hypothetical protein